MQLFIRVVKRLIISQIKENAENECIDNFFAQLEINACHAKKNRFMSRSM